jgi:signal peptidase I
METSSPKPRRPWLAGIMSLPFGPVGQVYVGRLRRSLFLWLIGGCIFPILAFCTVGLPIGRFGFVLLCLCTVAVPVYYVADALLLARRHRHALPKPYQRWWVYVLLYAVFCSGNYAVACFVRSFIAEAFIVPTRGMSPTIRAGDRIAVYRRWYNRKRIHRGEVVAYRSEGPDSPIYVQRVAGLPGDEIEIKNERVFVNGAEWDDPHAVFDGPLPPYADMVNRGPVKIPMDYCFLLGDNRRMSKDSRLIGPIPMSHLYGVARFIYWSQERTFPNPHDITHYVLGPIHWDRMGLRLD